jgi:hypothetical protein
MIIWSTLNRVGAQPLSQCARIQSNGYVTLFLNRFREKSALFARRRDKSYPFRTHVSLYQEMIVFAALLQHGKMRSRSSYSKDGQVLKDKFLYFNTTAFIHNDCSHFIVSSFVYQFKFGCTYIGIHICTNMMKYTVCTYM